MIMALLSLALLWPLCPNASDWGLGKHFVPLIAFVLLASFFLLLLLMLLQSGRHSPARTIFLYYDPWRRYPDAQRAVQVVVAAISAPTIEVDALRVVGGRAPRRRRIERGAPTAAFVHYLSHYKY